MISNVHPVKTTCACNSLDITIIEPLILTVGITKCLVRFGQVVTKFTNSDLTSQRKIQYCPAGGNEILNLLSKFRCMKEDIESAT